MRSCRPELQIQSIHCDTDRAPQNKTRHKKKRDTIRGYSRLFGFYQLPLAIVRSTEPFSSEVTDLETGAVKISLQVPNTSKNTFGNFYSNFGDVSKSRNELYVFRRHARRTSP